MTTLNTDGVTGIDGHSPIWLAGPWRYWNRDQIYWGPDTPAEGRYVPNVNDYIKDLATNIDYRVTDVDITTLIPTVVKVKTQMSDGVLAEEDVLLGVGPGTAAETWLLYCDKSVMPHMLAVERRLQIPGVEAKYAMIHRGADIGSPQKIISAFYDTQGNLLGQKIPLELVLFDNSEIENRAIYVIPTCYTTEDLLDNEIVTVSIWSDQNMVLSKRQLKVENTAFVAGPNAAAKYVMDIGLETPALSPADSNLIEFPLNVPIEGLNLMGVALYSDGSRLRMPVDGTKFRLDGLAAYVTSQVGQKIPIQLVYTLSPDEIAYQNVLTNGEQRFIPKQMHARTKEVNGALSPKLYCYPVWIDALNGYRLEWWLANLERGPILRATPHVRINTNYAVFNPHLLGSMQRLAVTVNLKDVNPSLEAFNHTQTVEITLRNPGTDHSGDGNWSVGFDPGQNPPFGVQNNAVTTFINANLYKVKIDLGETAFENWLERIYKRTRPLYNPSRENAAPEPTHFAFVFTDATYVFPIAEWNVEHQISHAVPDSDTLFIKFFKRTADNDIELSTAGIPVYQA